MLLINLAINTAAGLEAGMRGGPRELFLVLSVVWWEGSYRNNRDKVKKDEYNKAISFRTAFVV